MNCKQCGYRLWNLASRLCPECGEPFVPSEFRFAPNSVQFCCPHCRQPYYGTDEHGLPTPRSFTCIGCSRDIDLDEMVLIPADGDEQATLAKTHPWIDPKRRGLFGRLTSSIFMALSEPGRMMRLVPPESETSRAWRFALAANFLIMLVVMLPTVGFMMLAIGAAGTPPVMPPLFLAGIWGCMGFSAIAGLVVGVILWGLSAHAILRLTGETPYGVGRTIQCLLYSSGANGATVVPGCGWYFGWIWWLVSASAAIKEGQEVSGGRAAGAVLVPPLGVGACVAVLYGLLIAAAISANPGMAGSSPFVPELAANREKLDTIAAGFELYASLNDTSPVGEHPILLVQEGHVLPEVFIGHRSNTQLSSIPAGSTTLEAFRSLDLRQQKRVLREAKQLLPPTDQAYRVGDVVFVGLGDPPPTDQRLWAMLLVPYASVTARLPAQIVIRFADGHVEIVRRGSLSQLLQKQNDLRKQYGLPPIPMPTTLPQMEAEPPPDVIGDR